MALDILVIGGSGFVGGRVLKAAASQGLTAAFTYAHHNRVPDFPAFMVDLEPKDGAPEDGAPEDGALEACLAQTRPNAVIYCAVPPVGSDEAAHYQVSVRGVERLISCLARGTRLVYVSTNAVFTGFSGPYREDAPCEERSDHYRAYGLMRAKGESLVLRLWPESIVVRTSHVEGRDTQGNMHWRLAEVVNRLLAGQPLPRFTDRVISPTWVQTLAQGLIEVSSPAFSFRGVLHIAGSQYLTDYAYARLLARALGVDEALVLPDKLFPNASGTAQYNLGLDTKFTQGVIQTRLYGAAECLHDILNG